MTAGGQLESGERVDRHRVRRDPVYVAERDLGLARRQERADAVAEAREVAPCDRPVDGELERARVAGHPSFDRGERRNSSAARR